MNKTKPGNDTPHVIYVRLSDRDRARLAVIEKFYESVTITEAVRTAIRLTEAAISAQKVS